MANRDDQAADVFAIPELWPTSTWLDQLPRDDDDAPFFAPKIDLDGLKPPDPPVLQVAAVVADDDGFFAFPGVKGQDSHGKDGLEPVSERLDKSESSPETEDHDSDIWMELDEAVPEPAALRTWESFISQASPANDSLLVSEAGAVAYDALLSQPGDPLRLKSGVVPLVDPGAYFSALLSLALGRGSLLFQKMEPESKFQSALPEFRISGYSSDVMEGLLKQCRASGRIMLELQTLIRKTYARDSLQCQTALASVLDEILRSLLQNVVAHSHNPRSLLQLQHTVHGIMAILGPLYKLASKLDRAHSEEEILSHIFLYSSSIASDESWIHEIFQTVLRRVSGPWTEFMEVWVGTRQEEGTPFTRSEANIGRCKGFVKIDRVNYIDESGEEVNSIEYCLDRAKVPTFMPDDILQVLFDAGSNLRFIRSNHPEHPLSQPGILRATEPPEAAWHFDWESILELEAKVAEYQNRLLQAMSKAPDNIEGPVFTDDRPQRPDSGHQLDLFMEDEHGLDERILASINHLNTQVSSTMAESQLDRIVRQRLGNSNEPASVLSKTTPHWSLLPVLCFGSIISTQAQIINREMLQLLFTAHDLREHLNIQREFHLLGNGMFCSRLSHALFDPELEKTERQAGVARQGGVMGLRLGRRDTWPPASSELRLALMGVLSDSYCPEKVSDKMTNSYREGLVPLPGDLSFAVRDLSEEEIEKCMDPDGLEALDFLRISYKTPMELRCIITPEIMAHYDQILKHLLRMLRMLYVVNQLWRDTNVAREDTSEVVYRFAREARHFVSSIASYFMDTGIALPWQAFVAKLDEIETSLKRAQSTGGGLEDLESPEQLQIFHSRVLKSIMSALFLRKRQEPILQLVMDILSLILQFSKQHHAVGSKGGILEGEQFISLYKQLKKKIQIFITVCRGLGERNRGGKAGEGVAGPMLEGISDEAMIAQLLLKLDMNSHYTKS
jgi:hypothetical protein